MADFRVGVIGLGWGVITHVPAFRAAAGYDVVALCGRRPDAVTAAATEAGIQQTSTDWRSFVTRDDIDVISVATPVTSHVEIGLAALAAGKHLIMEKPVAVTVAEADKLASAADRLGLVSAVCFEQRWTAHRQAILGLVRDGFLGAPYLVRQVTSASYWHPSRPPQSDWMYSIAAGGGYLQGNMTHDIDFIRTAFGSFESVAADVTTSVPRRQAADGSPIDVDADDTTTILAHLAGGTRAVLSTTTVGAHTGSTVFEAFGSAGTIVVRTTPDGTQLLAGRATATGLEPVAATAPQPSAPSAIPQRRAAPLITALAVMLEQLLPAFDGKRVEVPSLREAMHVERVVHAVREASTLRRWVDVTSD